MKAYFLQEIQSMEMQVLIFSQSYRPLRSLVYSENLIRTFLLF